MVDDLTGILAGLHIRTTLFAMAELPPDWGVAFPASPGAYFHLVVGGEGWLRTDAGETVRLVPGQVTLLPQGSAHRLTGVEGAVPRVVFDPVTWRPNGMVTAGAEGSAASLVCGAVELPGPDRGLLLGAMPPVVVASGPELETTLTLLDQETRSARAGSEAVLARLGDVLLVQLVRSWLEGDGGARVGWLAALGDPQIGRSLRAMHADPAAAWTVESLAREARLSRSRFAERFTALVGRAPLDYLTRWRLELAAGLLREGRTSREAGRSVGYTSTAAFGRAFTRHHGQPPGRARG